MDFSIHFVKKSTYFTSSITWIFYTFCKKSTYFTSRITWIFVYIL